MNAPDWLPIEVVINEHQNQIERHGGRPGTKDIGSNPRSPEQKTYGLMANQTLQIWQRHSRMGSSTTMHSLTATNVFLFLPPLASYV